MGARASVPVLTAVITAACGSSPPAPVPPDQPGPYGVGVVTWDLHDDARDGRPVTVEVWYPAEVAPGDERDLVLGVIESGAVRDAPPDPAGAPYPLVIFSHGYQGIRNQSFYLTEHLAAHGFVVAAPDHFGNTFASGGGDAEVFLRRPEDVSFTVDQTLARAAGPPLAGLVDAGRIAVTGHSFGGWTTLVAAGAPIDMVYLREFCGDGGTSLACDALAVVAADVDEIVLADGRFAAAIAVAPAGRAAFGPVGLAAIDVPVMIQAGDADRTAPLDGEAREIADGLADDRELVIVEGAGHFSFTNACPLYELLGGARGPFAIAGEEGCGPGAVPIEQAHARSRAYAAAFLRAHLTGDAVAADFLAAAPPAGVRLE